LAYAGYRVISLRPHTQLFSLDKLFAGFFRVKPAEVVLFYRQLALLLESGISIVTALELLRAEISKRTFRKVLGEVIFDLRGGNQLSTALAKHPRIFSPIYCRLLSVGERAGNLEVLLRQVADYMEKHMATAKKIKGALRYPMITGIIAVVIVILLVVFVFPTFNKLYTSLGTELPAISRIVFEGVGKLRSLGSYIMLVALAVIGIVLFYVKTAAGRYKWHGLLLRLPLVGRVIHLNQLASCCRNISLLYDAGLPLTEIMPLVTQACGNSFMAKALSDVHKDMTQGEGLSKPMQKNPIFLPMMVQMVKVGEETGNLNTALSAAAQSYETEAEDRTSSLVSYIQPAMTGIIGLIIGFIAISLFSAIYSIYGQLA
jgi:type IV pilus assembly protein PilC